MWHTHQRVPSKEHCLLWPDRAVPNTLTTRQQIHHGCGGNRQQCNTRQTHQQLQIWRAHASVQSNYVKNATSRNNSKKAYTGQLSVRIPEDNNTKWIQNSAIASTTGHTPKKCSRSCHTKFQGALTQYTGSHRTIFSPIIVGQALTTGRNNNQPIAAVQCNFQRFSICPSERPV